jgi:two-component system, chemotaxis family, sensor kinase CheA
VSIDSEFLEIFRDEASDRLDAMVAALLSVEAGAGTAETIDSLLREVHTIKGSAAAVGLEAVGAIAHAAEDVLTGARDAGALDPGRVEPLLQAVDALRRIIGGGTADDEDAVVAALSGAHVAPKAQNGSAEAAQASPDARAIRVSAQKIDRLLDVVGETVMNRRRLEHVLGDEPGGNGAELLDELDLGERLLAELTDTAIDLRTLPLSSIVGPFPRAVRDMAKAHGKKAELVVEGAETELDRVILESLSQPLVHILRNAVAHGIELPDDRAAAGKDATGRVELRAVQRGRYVEITVADDGRGIAPELLAAAAQAGSLADVVTKAGLSTAGGVDDLSGRGVGLDAVKIQVESVGGTIDVESEPGVGTAIVLSLPLALALLDVLLVERDGRPFGIPLASVDEAVAVSETLSLSGRQSLEIRGQTLPIADLGDVVLASTPLPDRPPAVVISAAGRRAAVSCDRLLGEEEVVVKPLGPLLAGVPGYLGAAILGDGRIALLLDPATLVRPTTRTKVRPVSVEPAPRLTRPKVLVVEDSITVRELQRSILEAAGYRVETAPNGRDALTRVLADDELELVLTDVQMPEMSGLELTAAIRATPSRASIPVVILTSLADEEQRRKGLEAGADEYMVKRGFDQGALLETVERLLAS